jgi:hypothetical protein
VIGDHTSGDERIRPIADDGERLARQVQPVDVIGAGDRCRRDAGDVGVEEHERDVLGRRREAAVLRVADAGRRREPVRVHDDVIHRRVRPVSFRIERDP